MNVVSLLIELPFPPTVNSYWRRVGNRTLLSEGARKYRAAVQDAVADLTIRRMEFRLGLRKTITVPVAVEIEFRPPDRRRRDLDNLPKGLLDALKHAGIYADDSQVRQLNMWFGPIQEGGLSVVRIVEFAAE